MSGLVSDYPDNSAKCGNTGKSFYIKPNDEHNLLRPETVESLFILYQYGDLQKIQSIEYGVGKYLKHFKSTVKSRLVVIRQ